LILRACAWECLALNLAQSVDAGRELWLAVSLRLAALIHPDANDPELARRESMPVGRPDPPGVTLDSLFEKAIDCPLLGIADEDPIEWIARCRRG